MNNLSSLRGILSQGALCMDIMYSLESLAKSLDDSINDDTFPPYSLAASIAFIL